MAAEGADDLSADVTIRLRDRSRRLLRSLLRPHRRAVWIAVVALLLLQNAAAMTGPYLVEVGIDRGIPPLQRGGRPTVLIVVTVAFVVAAFVEYVSKRAFLVASGKVGQAVLYDLRTRVYDHFQRLSPAFHERYTSGRVISRLTSDVDALGELLDGGIDDLVVAALSVGSVGVILLFLDLPMGLVTLLSFPLLLWLSRWFRRNSAIAYRRTRETVALVIVHFVESLGGIRAVQAFRREPRNQEIFEALNHDYRLANERAFKLVAIFAPGIKLIGNVTVAVVLVYGGYRVMGGQTQVGVLAAFLLYLRRFFEPMQELSMFYNSLQSATAALEKLSGVLDETPAVAEPEHPVALPAHRGTGRPRRRALRLPRRRRAARPRPAHPGRADRRAGGRDRRRQDHDRAAGRPLLRPGRGCRAARRRRPARPLRGRPAARGGDGDPGELPVRRHGRREHPLRPAGGERPLGRGRGTGHRRARLHRGAARRLRHRRRQARRPAVGRAAPARRVRPGVPRRPGGADPRRGDLVARHPERAAGPAGAAHDPGRPYGADHRPPAVHRGDRRPGAGARRRPDHRGRQPGRAGQRRRRLRRPARRLGRLARLGTSPEDRRMDLGSNSTAIRSAGRSCRTRCPMPAARRPRGRRAGRTSSRRAARLRLSRRRQPELRARRGCPSSSR